MTNLHLNKVLYFMYVEFMKEYDSPVTRAKIEAWNYGPVFREVYNQFKHLKDAPIACRATRVDYDSGQRIEASANFLPVHREFLMSVADYYAGFPASLLVEISHEAGGAWMAVWNHKGDLNVGMEITPTLVKVLEVNRKTRVRRN